MLLSSPDSCHILTTSNFHLRISVWSLVTKSVLYIRYPKPGVDFAFISTGHRLRKHAPCSVGVSVPTFRLCSLLVQLQPVGDVRWDPAHSRLAVCTRGDKLYVWSPAGCVRISVPRNYAAAAESLVWCPAGTAIALVDSSQFTVCYFVFLI